MTRKISSQVLGDARVAVRSHSRIPCSVSEGTSCEALELSSSDGSSVGRSVAGFSGTSRVLRCLGFFIFKNEIMLWSSTLSREYV